MSAAISMACIFTGFSSRADGSLSFRGQTPELTTPEKVALMDLQNRNVRLLAQPTDDPTDAIVEVKAPLGFKTPGQRLRSVLFVEWKAKRPPDMLFDEYYLREMERIIEYRKSQLPPE